MRRSEIIVKIRGFLPRCFSRHGFRRPSKYAKIKDNKMEKRFVVRRVRAADIPAILEIETASFGSDAYDRKLFAEYTRDCGELFLVALGGTRVVGYAITCVCRRSFDRASRSVPSGRCASGAMPPCQGLRAELVSIAVHPSVLGQGAAAALMKSLLRRLKLRRVTRFGLTVKVTNHRAIAFYEKYGFRKLRRVRRYYEDAADGFLFVKDL
jgi:ribosomal-protein-alanine N-acetyltransferase